MAGSAQKRAHGTRLFEPFIDVTATARICHEVNRAYCASIGDSSQVSWDEAEDWQRDSAVKGVLFAIENPDVTPKQQMKDVLFSAVVRAAIANGLRPSDEPTMCVQLIGREKGEE